MVTLREVIILYNNKDKILKQSMSLCNKKVLKQKLYRIRQKRKLKQGGPGSGCVGENCGRPPINGGNNDENGDGSNQLSDDEISQYSDNIEEMVDSEVENTLGGMDYNDGINELPETTSDYLNSDEGQELLEQTAIETANDDGLDFNSLSEDEQDSYRNVVEERF